MMMIIINNIIFPCIDKEELKHQTIYIFFSDSAPSQLAPKRTRPVNLETQGIKQELTALLKHLKRSAAEDFVKFVQGLINKLYQCVDTPVDDVSELVQDFYHDLSERMALHPLYKGNRKKNGIIWYPLKTHRIGGNCKLLRGTSNVVQ